jgi:hypothetical protein
MFKIFIDSAKRTSASASSTDFHVHFTGNFPQIDFAELHWTQIPLANFTVPKTGNVINFNENSTNKTATVTPGYYSGTALAQKVQDALNSASGGYNTYAVTYDSSTFLMTVSATQPFSLLWASQPSLNIQCGFAKTNTTAGTSVTSTQACQLNLPLAANISIRELDSVVYTGSIMLGSTFILPLSSGSSYLNSYEPQNRLINRTMPRVFNRFYIRLTDMDGNVLDLGNSDWSFAMTLYTKEEARKRLGEDLEERPLKMQC